MTEIKLFKSTANDYFVLQKSSDIPFYFQKEDLKPLIEKLIELKEEIMHGERNVKKT